jgi:hypothetical protein
VNLTGGGIEYVKIRKSHAKTASTDQQLGYFCLVVFGVTKQKT